MAHLLLRTLAALALLLALRPSALAQKFYTYVGDLAADHVLIAWGTTAGENTIGRSSRSARAGRGPHRW